MVGMTLHEHLSENDIRDSGGGFTGKGCVFDARSSGTSLADTGRSSTP